MKMIFALLLTFTTSAFADSSVGCGLGSMIFKKNSVISASSRSITNASFSSQLFGITSGTSGCSQHSIVKNEMAPVYIAEANFDELKKEMALGQGETLAAFHEAFGCEASSLSDFSALVKKNYNTVFEAPNANAHDMLGSVKKLMSTQKNLQCPYAII